MESTKLIIRCGTCKQRFAAARSSRRFCSPACRQKGYRRRRRRSVHFKSESDNWSTPKHLFDELDREFGFTLDVCASDDNAKCDRYFTESDDGLSQPWVDNVCWMNPPYGRQIGDWMRKAYESSLGGATVVCLVPARTDTKWWHTYATKGSVRFLPGRLKFGNAPNCAPFPSAIIIFKSVSVTESTLR